MLCIMLYVMCCTCTGLVVSHVQHTALHHGYHMLCIMYPTHMLHNAHVTVHDATHGVCGGVYHVAGRVLTLSNVKCEYSMYDTCPGERKWGT